MASKLKTANDKGAKTPRKAVTKPASARGAAPERDDDDNIGDEADGVAFNAEKFVEHVKDMAALKAKSAEVRGKIGAAVKNAEEDHGIHRGASALWIKLDRMEDEARDAFLKAFDDMRTALGYATQSDLFDATTPADKATFAGRGAN